MDQVGICCDGVDEWRINLCCAIGYYEGPGNVELQEPLHLNVSADSEDMLRLVVDKVRQLIQTVKSELERK